MMVTLPSTGIAALLRSACVAALVAMFTLPILPGIAVAADPDLARAEQLVRDAKYQEAYDLLAPFEDARKGDAEFNYLLGRAALGTKRPEKALALFERSLAQRPNDAAAHLALGRAYFALGRYAEAKIEFETVLRVDDLPPDLLTQVEIYDQLARQSLDEGRRLTSFGYAETGIGGYRVNSTRGTDAFGGGDRSDSFFNARVGGGLNYALDNGYALDANLDYRFRSFDNDDIRNDSDWRWRAAGSRAFGENNLAVGFRGRVSYRGGGQYRNDYSIFTNYRYRYDEDNQFTVGAELQRRRYPDGPLRERSRTTATATAGWVRSLFDGRGSFSLTGHGGYNYATSRPDGDSAIYGATANLDYTFTDRLAGFMFAWWERDAFNTDAIHFHPDSLDEGVVLRRKDNLYEFGGGLVWEFARGWTFRPEILYIRDESNSVGFNYSSTEYWLNVRKAF
ncbi:MAG TPA: tetratricopeptide repeat protein [Burkholderiales bacterium]|nr:tetratricopeptide repeat protein [Burkholderiales bacterium]